LTPPPPEACLAPSTEATLRSFEIIAGLLVAAILFVLLKLIGLVMKFALIAALVGFAVGWVAARALRR